MKQEYKIKGITLTMADMVQINQYYEEACTAEYLYENYEVTEEEAWSYASEIRRLMNKYDYTEDEAIEQVVKAKQREFY